MKPINEKTIAEYLIFVLFDENHYWFSKKLQDRISYRRIKEQIKLI